MVLEKFHKVIKLPRGSDILDLHFFVSKDSRIEIFALFEIAVILRLVYVHDVTAASLLL